MLEHHILHLQEVLWTIQTNQLFLKLKKSNFTQTKVNYFGH